MAVVVNERDVIMRRAPARIVSVTAPSEVITPNTGITLVSDCGQWLKMPAGDLYWNRPPGSLARETLTVVFKDIPSNNPLVWKIGSWARAWSEAKQAMVLSWFSETTVANHGVVLTGTGNTRTVEMSSYTSNLPHPSTQYNRICGGVRVSTTYAGTEFVGFKVVSEEGYAS